MGHAISNMDLLNKDKTKAFGRDIMNLLVKG